MLTAISSKEFREVFPSLTSLRDASIVASVAAVASESHYSSGSVVLKENAHSQKLFFLLEGVLNTFVEKKGKRIQLGDTLPGNVVGEVSLFGSCLTTATVVAKTDCRILVLGKSQLDKLQTDAPQFVSQLLRSISITLANRLLDIDKELCDELVDHEGESPAHATPKRVTFYTNMYKRIHGHAEA